MTTNRVDRVLVGQELEETIDTIRNNRDPKHKHAILTVLFNDYYYDENASMTQDDLYAIQQTLTGDDTTYKRSWDQQFVSKSSLLKSVAPKVWGEKWDVIKDNKSIYTTYALAPRNFEYPSILNNTLEQVLVIHTFHAKKSGYTKIPPLEGLAAEMSCVDSSIVGVTALLEAVSGHKNTNITPVLWPGDKVYGTPEAERIVTLDTLDSFSSAPYHTTNASKDSHSAKQKLKDSKKVDYLVKQLQSTTFSTNSAIIFASAKIAPISLRTWARIANDGRVVLSDTALWGVGIQSSRRFSANHGNDKKLFDVAELYDTIKFVTQKELKVFGVVCEERSVDVPAGKYITRKDSSISLDRAKDICALASALASNVVRMAKNVCMMHVMNRKWGQPGDYLPLIAAVGDEVQDGEMEPRAGDGDNLDNAQQPIASGSGSKVLKAPAAENDSDIEIIDQPVASGSGLKKIKRAPKEGNSDIEIIEPKKAKKEGKK